MICLLFLPHPSLCFCQLWPLMLPTVCERETAAKGPLFFFHSAPPPPPLLSANKFHATLCEPSNIPNNANSLFANDICVAFQQALWGKNFVISCQETHSSY